MERLRGLGAVACVRGLFVVFEGIDGSGKSTLLKRVGQDLGPGGSRAGIARRFGRPCLLREPTYESPAGLRLRQMLGRAEAADATFWLSLFLEDREHNVRTNVLPRLRSGRLVLQDRYYYSTAAYQGRASGPTSTEIWESNLRRGFPTPDLVVYLTLPVEVALARIRASRGLAESFESHEELRRISENYELVIPPDALRLDTTAPLSHLVECVGARIVELSRKGRRPDRRRAGHLRRT